MKKYLIIIALALLTACGTSRYATQRTIQDMDEVSYVLANYYPQLHEYYMEGVLKIKSVKEVITDEGEPAYNVKYDFCRYNYPNFNDRMEALKTYYPEVYQMYLNGVVEVTSFYKYVDKDTGKIMHHVSFRRIYDFYYNTGPYYGGTRLIYRPRPFPNFRPRVEPRPVRPQPKPEAGPGGRPGGQPGGRPGGGRPGGGGPRGGRR